MVSRKLKTEKMTIKQEVLMQDDHVFWVSEMFDNDITKPTYLIIDDYPVDSHPATTISLTRSLAHNQVANQLGGRGFWLAHLYYQRPKHLTNSELAGVDEEYVAINIAEITKVAKKATHIIVATGSLTRKFQAASNRLKQLLDALDAELLTNKIEFLVAGDSNLPAAIVSRHVRVGLGDWQLRPKDLVTWWKK